MQARITIFALALALTVVTAPQSRAQVLWSAAASDCVLQTGGANLASSDAAHGIVTFAAGASGDIKLTCPVPFRAFGQEGANNLNMTFYNDWGYQGGVNHCFIDADLLRGNLTLERGADIASVRTQNQTFFGRHVLGSGLLEDIDFQHNYYWVDIQLHRDSPRATCNPAIVGTFLNIWIQ